MSGIPSVAWIKQYPDVNTVGNDQNSNIVADSFSNTYITYFTDAGAVSGGTNAGGTGDIVVFKLNKDGQIVWIRQQIVMNTSAADTSPSICIDFSSTNIYVAYNSTGRVSGGVTTGLDDIVVFKMDTNGTLQWISQQRVMNTNQNDRSRSISIDASNNVYVTYETMGTVSGGINIGLRDTVVFKMDSSGTLVWIKEYPQSNTTANDYSPIIATEPNGNSCIAYSTLGGTVSGGGGSGNYDIVIYKVDSSGNFLWAAQNGQINTNNIDIEPTIAIDSSSNVYVAFSTFSGTPSYNIDIVKLNSSGSFLWKKTITSINNKAERVPSMKINSTGIYITFVTNGGIMSGGTNTGSDDIVVCMLDFDGNVIWVLQQPLFNTTLSNTSPSITVDSSNNIYVSYQTAGTVSGGTFIGSGGNTNIIVFKLAPTPPPTLPPPVFIRPRSMNSSIQFWWKPITEVAPVTSFFLTNGSLSYTIPSNTYTHIVSGLTNGTPYSFTLAASNFGGLSPSAPFRTVQPGSLSDPITNIQVEDQPNQFVFTWTNPSNYGSVTPIRNIVTCFPVDLSDNIIHNRANYIYASTYPDKTVRVIQKSSFTPSTRYKAAAQVVNDVGYSPIISYSSIFSV
jgi:hypothetical protein